MKCLLEASYRLLLNKLYISLKIFLCHTIKEIAINWNKKAIDFYLKIGAIPMDEWTVFRVTGQALEELTHS